MNQSQKRKRQGPGPKPASGLAEADELVLNNIKSKGKNAITQRKIQLETKLSDKLVKKCIKSLMDLSLIKEINHAEIKGKHYIAAECKPSDTVSGGEWYVDGKLDTELIEQLKDMCLRTVRKLKVTTAEGVYEFIKNHGLTHTEFTSHQISEILGAMVLENMIIEVKSSGQGEYHSIPVGNVCYKSRNQGVKRGAMASIPCGVCPRMKECAPDGLISPTSCVYYTKWLEF